MITFILVSLAVLLWFGVIKFFVSVQRTDEHTATSLEDKLMWKLCDGLSTCIDTLNYSTFIGRLKAVLFYAVFLPLCIVILLIVQGLSLPGKIIKFIWCCFKWVAVGGKFWRWGWDTRKRKWLVSDSQCKGCQYYKDGNCCVVLKYRDNKRSK